MMLSLILFHTGTKLVDQVEKEEIASFYVKKVTLYRSTRDIRGYHIKPKFQRSLVNRDLIRPVHLLQLNYIQCH